MAARHVLADVFVFVVVSAQAPATTAAPAGGKERPDSSSPSVPVSPPLPSKPPPSVQGANSADIDQCHTPSVDDAAQAPAAAPLEPPPAPRVLRGLYIVGKVRRGVAVRGTNEEVTK